MAGPEEEEGGKRLWEEVKASIRKQSHLNEDGFLFVEDYVESIFEKYGDLGGGQPSMDAEGFKQAVLDITGESPSVVDADSAFHQFEKGTGAAGVAAVSMQEMLQAVLMTETEVRDACRHLREQLKKKFGRRDSQLRDMYDLLAEPHRGASISPRVLANLLDDWLSLDVSEEEARALLSLIDIDGDGAASLDDFLGFVGPAGEDVVATGAIAGLLSKASGAIVDIHVSTSRAEEAELEANGYRRVDANLNEGTFGRSVHLWYRRRKHGGAGARLKPLVDILIDSKNVNSALVVDGYQCLQRNINKGNTLSRSQYFWVRRATTEEQEERDSILDIAITTGKSKDRTSEIYTPPGRGYLLVPGNLNGGTIGKDTFLWYKPIRARRTGSQHMGGTSYHVASTMSEAKRQMMLEQNIRRHVREYVSPKNVNKEGGASMDYSSLFNKFDAKGKGLLTKRQLQKLLREVGLNVSSKDLTLFLGRLDKDGSKLLDRREWLAFVSLTGDELDEVADLLRRKFGVGMFRKIGQARREQIKALRRKFEGLDRDGDGLLDRSDFSRMLHECGVYLTRPEQSALRSRFDGKEDGLERVDLLHFLNFFLSKEDKDKRAAARVGRALERLRDYVLSLQVSKIQQSNADAVDSSTAWKEIAKLHKLSTKKPFPDYATVEDIACFLEKVDPSVRLSHRELHQLVMRISPGGEGRISPEAFHQFAVQQSRMLGPLLRIMEREALQGLVEAYRRLRHKQHRQVYQEIAVRTEDTPGGTASPTHHLGLGNTRTHARGGAAGGLGHSAMFSSPVHRSSPRAQSPMRNTFQGVGAGSPLSRGRRGGDNAFLASSMSPLARGGSGVGGASGIGGGGGGNHGAAPNHDYNLFGTMDLEDTEAPALREEFSRQLQHLVLALKPDEHGFTTIQNIREGIAQATGLDAKALLDTEWALLAQAVGADEAELFVVDAKRLLEGACMSCLLESDNGNDEITLEDIARTTEEALNLVCEDLVKMIEEEGKQGGEGGGGGAGGIDYERPFRLFDEAGNGAIHVDDFRRMLYRLNVDSLLREGQVVQLINRFDPQRKGEVTLADFIAFATRETWDSVPGGDEEEALLLEERGMGTWKSRTRFGNTGMNFKATAAGGGGGGRHGVPPLRLGQSWGGNDVGQGSSPRGEGGSPRHSARFHGLKLTGSSSGDEVVLGILRRCQTVFEGGAAYGNGAKSRGGGPPGAWGSPRGNSPFADDPFFGGRGNNNNNNKPQQTPQRRLTQQQRKAWFERAKNGLLSAFEALDHAREGSLSLGMTVTALRRAALDPGLPERDLERGLSSFMIANAGANGRVVDYLKIVAAVKRAWKLTLLTGRGGGGMGITEDPRVNAKIAQLQKEFRQVSQVKATNPTTGHTTYSYKMGRAFRKLDLNGDGVINPQEFKAGLRALGVGASLRDRDIRMLFNACDVDGSEGLDYREFCDLLLHGTLADATSPRSGGGRGGVYSSDDELDDDDDDDDALFGEGADGAALFGLSAIMQETAAVLWAFAPSETRQKHVERFFQSKDVQGRGFVKERRFVDFLRKAGVTGTLSPEKVTDLVEELDPRNRGEIDYKKFLRMVFDIGKPSDKAGRGAGKGGGGDSIAPLLHKLQTAIVAAAARGRTFHGLFQLSDEAQSGLVSLEAYQHTLRMLGATDLSTEEAQMVADGLKSRDDHMVDYEELYRLLLATPPPQHLAGPSAGGPPHRSLYSGGVALWPPPATMPSAQMDLGIGGRGGGGLLGQGTRGMGDPLLDEVCARVRQRVLEKAQQWGSSFSLARQFEHHDPRHRGVVTAEDLAAVLDGLGVFLSSPELQHVVRAFDRYGDNGVDYQSFCQRVMFDSREMETLADKLQRRFEDLRRSGVEPRAAFEMFDLSRTGFVTRADLREAAKKLSLPLTEHQLQGLYTRFAQLGDPDSISYEDLLSFSSSSLLPQAFSPRRLGGRGEHRPSSWRGANGDSDDYDDDRARSRRTGGPPRVTVPKLNDIGAVTSPRRGLSPRGEGGLLSPGRMGGGMRSPLSPSAQGARAWGAHTPLSQKGSLAFARSISSATSWMCAVCFFTENSSKKQLCEICNAPNPDTNAAELQQQCPNCSFDNGELCVECQMCGEPLPYGRARARAKTAAVGGARGSSRTRRRTKSGWSGEDDHDERAGSSDSEDDDGAGSCFGFGGGRRGGRERDDDSVENYRQPPRGRARGRGRPHRN